MFAGQPQEHKVGMCPLCLKARVGVYEQPNYEEQYARAVKAEPQDNYSPRYGRPPTTGGPSGHPASKTSKRGYDGYIAAAKIPQYPASEPPQLLPQNLAAHTPIPIPAPPLKKRSKESRYPPPGANGRPRTEERPVFEPPTLHVPLDTANGKQGKGTRKTSPRLKQKKTKRSVKSSTSDDEEEPELNDDEYQPPQATARKQARARVYTQPISVQARPELQPPAAPQAYPQDDFLIGLIPYNASGGFQADFFDHLNDLNQPTGLSQPLDIKFSRHQIQQSGFIDPSLLLNTRSHYSEAVSYGGANDGGKATKAGHNQTNGGNGQASSGYTPPIFGQNYPYTKPSATALSQSPAFDPASITDNGFMGNDTMFADIDWDSFDTSFDNNFVIDPVLDMQMGGMDFYHPAVPSPVDSGVYFSGSDNLYVQMSDQKMGGTAQPVYSFPGSVLPMPAVNAQGRRTDRLERPEIAVERTVEKPDPDDDYMDDPMAPLFPDD